MNRVRKSTTKPKRVRKKIGGIDFKQVSCSTAYSASDKAANAIRAKGYKARVIKSGGSFCVFAGSKIKSKKK